MDTPHPPKLQHYWILINRLFNVTSRTLVGRDLPVCRDTVGVFYSHKLTEIHFLVCMYTGYIKNWFGLVLWHTNHCWLLLYNGSYHVTSGIAEAEETLCFLSTTEAERERDRELWKISISNRPTSDVTPTAWDLKYLSDFS